MEPQTHNVLIAGSDTMLAMYLAAESFTSADKVHLLLHKCDGYLKEHILNQMQRLVQQKAAQAGAIARCVRENLNVIVTNMNDGELGHIIRDYRVPHVWFSGTSSTKPTELDRSAKFALYVVGALAGSNVRTFSYIRPFYASDPASRSEVEFGPEYLGSAEAERHQRVTEIEIVDRCRASGMQCSLFCMPALVGECHSGGGPCRSGLSSFLAGLHELKTEIEERYPDYFEYQALRYFAPKALYLNVMSAEEAARMLCAITYENDTGARRQIVSRQNILFSEMCERVGMAYGLSLLTVDDPRELNAIDRLFDERVADAVRARLMSGLAPSIHDNRQVTFGKPIVACEEPSVAALDEIRRQQDAALRERSRRATAAVAELKQTTVQRHGSELSYFAGGLVGAPIVILNALGQGLRYWDRLMFELMKRHCIIIWEPRGIVSAQPCYLKDHVDDLDEILRNEGIEECHLVAWCTGPKVAAEFCLRRPDVVASMVFLNAAFKSTLTPQELTTDYEDKIEPIFRLLDSSPGIAGVVMKSLRQFAMDGEMPDASQLDGKEMAVRALSLTNADLLTEVVGPYQSEAGTVNYARQVLDFYSCDISAQASKINAPVLLIGAEYDKIASPEISQVFARLFPRGRYVEVKGATHYCLYDRAAFLSDLMEEFFEAHQSRDRDTEEMGQVPILQT